MALLSDPHRSITIEDPFQCCAALHLAFECAQCGKNELYEGVLGGYLGVDWIRLAADAAREDGWFVAPWNARGEVDTTALCPSCRE